MSLPRERYSWDGDDDVPVRLDDSGCVLEPSPAGDTIAVAESAGRDAQEAITRQDRDPTSTLPEPLAAEPVNKPPRSVQRLRERMPRAFKAAVLAVGCALAFAHGWNVGATAEAGVDPAPCDAHHCSGSHED